MRLVQLSRHSIAFPSPEGALREPNGLLALGGDLPVNGLPAWYFSVVFSR
ncbi:Leucyl/phenylalanyl-tRNA--protein transferase (fragment) [Escherichia coli]